MGLPLAGYQVLDFTQAAFGPVCTMLLGDMGADIIKVEPLEGDLSRLTALREGDSIMFLTNNRNKRSLAVNLKDPRGKEVVWKLARQADAVVQNFRPGVMKELGLDYEAVRRENPAVIYGSFYMYGEEGPLAHRRGADPWAQGFTGVVASQGDPGETPYLAGHPFLDFGGAALNALALVTALLMRERTGQGQEVTNTLVSTGAFLQQTAINFYLVDGRLYKKGGRGSYRGQFPYGAYPAQDGDVVTLFGQDDDEWITICSILGLEHLVGDPRYDTVEKREERRRELYPLLDQAFRQRTRAEWEQLFRERGLRCDPCLDYAEFVAHPQFRANDLLVEMDHPRDGRIRVVGPPLKFKGVGKLEARRHAPVLGEHTREIMLELGYSAGEISLFQEQGAVGSCDEESFRQKPRIRAAIAIPKDRGAIRRKAELKAKTK